MPIFVPIEELRATLKDIRCRALNYAEYMLFSRMRISNVYVQTVTYEEWVTLVTQIEQAIKREEDEYLLMYFLTDFKPLGIIFRQVPDW